jgi:hypothetical protein
LLGREQTAPLLVRAGDRKLLGFHRFNSSSKLDP